jgi:hypothetical protein
MSFLKKLLRRYARDEKGTIIVDAVIVIPMFVWAYAGLFVYWDAYRSINTVQKASYTISDLISRTQGQVNDDFISGMQATMNYLLRADQGGQIRVTSYQWNVLNDRYEVIFSRAPGGGSMTALTTADLAGLVARLPTMSDGDSAILLETRVPYTPPLSFGLEPTTIEQFIVTRPRFLPKICHTSFAC